MFEYQEAFTKEQLKGNIPSERKPFLGEEFYRYERNKALNQLARLFSEFETYDNRRHFHDYEHAIWLQHRNILLCDQALDKFANGYVAPYDRRDGGE